MTARVSKPVLSEIVYDMLGGKCFEKRTGATKFIHTNDGLIFRMPPMWTKKTSNETAVIQIKLGSREMYDVTTFRFFPGINQVKKVSQISNVPLDKVPDAIRS